jgi:hypothetical protein
MSIARDGGFAVHKKAGGAGLFAGKPRSRITCGSHNCRTTLNSVGARLAGEGVFVGGARLEAAFAGKPAPGLRSTRADRVDPAPVHMVRQVHGHDIGGGKRFASMGQQGFGIELGLTMNMVPGVRGVALNRSPYKIAN